MAKCDVCGNEYDKTFQITAAGRTSTFDSFECATHALAPVCAHCHCTSRASVFGEPLPSRRERLHRFAQLRLCPESQTLSRTPVTPLCFAQCAQQYMALSASIPCPTITRRRRTSTSAVDLHGQRRRRLVAVGLTHRVPRARLRGCHGRQRAHSRFADRVCERRQRAAGRGAGIGHLSGVGARCAGRRGDSHAREPCVSQGAATQDGSELRLRIRQWRSRRRLHRVRRTGFASGWS